MIKIWKQWSLYDTNPNFMNYYIGNPSKSPYLPLCDPPKMGNSMTPVKLPGLFLERNYTPENIRTLTWQWITTHLSRCISYDLPLPVVSLLKGTYWGPRSWELSNKKKTTVQHLTNIIRSLISLWTSYLYTLFPGDAGFLPSTVTRLRKTSNHQRPLHGYL